MSEITKNSEVDLDKMIIIENFKDKFLAKMKQLADEDKKSKKYYRMEHYMMDEESVWHGVDFATTLFKAYNYYDLWLKIYPLGIIYYDLENDYDYNAMIVETLDEDVIETMDEDAQLEYIVKSEIKGHTYGDDECNDTIWWIEMNRII